MRILFPNPRSPFHLVRSGCLCACLVISKASTQSLLLEEILSRLAVALLRTRAIVEAIAHGQWKVVNHHATLNFLSSIIGQVPMAQLKGKLHVVHAFLG